MKREYKDYLKDICDCIDKIEKYTSEIPSFKKFLVDEKTGLAVIKLFENIGEAAKKIPSEVKNKYPDIPWKDMTGMRDILVHEYFGVDAEVLWKTAKEDIPILKLVFKELRKEYKI